ncbi:hypothetical protein MKZ38_006007 [Zalerion maritima]|uniref:DJ-1/PfpI domain-containing protein n=1 Tax=Zalerion maritima TaxID=339359 RepID=A0AAD5RK20_9PEZI|nr:hypothetical protein MKZ38_006007 [Zalerion maritima]
MEVKLAQRAAHCKSARKLIGQTEQGLPIAIFNIIFPALLFLTLVNLAQLAVASVNFIELVGEDTGTMHSSVVEEQIQDGLRYRIKRLRDPPSAKTAYILILISLLRRPSFIMVRPTLTLSLITSLAAIAAASPGGRGKDHHKSKDGYDNPGHGGAASTVTVTATVTATVTTTESGTCGLSTPTLKSEGIEYPPVKYGMLLFQAFEILDVYGPLEILNQLSRYHHLELSLISSDEDLSGVTTEPVTAAMNPLNSTVYPLLPPTHSIADPPMDLDVLIIPGGLGTRSPYLNNTVDYVTSVYPNLQHLISVCTGASIAARAGVLEGKRATTNKASWDSVVIYGDNVTWVPEARWVQDGNVWTSSGVSAGIDAVFAFVDEMYGSANATYIANLIEYGRHTDASWDPFAAIWEVETDE